MWDPPLEPEASRRSLTVSENDRSSKGSARPHFPKSSHRARAAAAAAAVFISTSILGGLLALFEVQSRDATAVRTTRPGMPSAPVAAMHPNTARS